MNNAAESSQPSGRVDVPESPGFNGQSLQPPAIQLVGGLDSPQISYNRRQWEAPKPMDSNIQPNQNNIA